MSYKDIFKNAIKSFEDLDNWLTSRKAKVDPKLKDVIAKYPMRVNTYYLGLIEKMNDGIWKQAIPDVEELEHYMDLSEDPLDDKIFSILPSEPHIGHIIGIFCVS
jgi:L-lysine 2,3-aminomutase